MFTTKTSITPQEAHKLMQSGDPYILLDVRTPSEFHEAHIEGAKLIPLDDLGVRLNELPDRNALILVYCRSGMRASNAVKLLSGKGYTNVFNFGGIMDWPYETVRG